MQRIDLRPRHGATEGAAAMGATYWDESAAYQLSETEVSALEKAANGLHGLIMSAADTVVRSEELMDRFHIPAAMHSYVRRSWETNQPTIYGRFDFAFTGGTIKLLEYNADTASSLLESTYMQHRWLQDVRPGAGQFNNTFGALAAEWQKIKGAVSDQPVFFASLQDIPEDLATANYMQNIATHVGLKTQSIDIRNIGWDPDNNRFDDSNGTPIKFLFKLYGWDQMAQDEPAYVERMAQDTVGVLEPAWKMILSSKAMLPYLWERYPGHPHLLPAFTSAATFTQTGTPYVQKPVFGREGLNIRIFDGDGAVISQQDGGYEDTSFIFQQKANMGSHNGNTPVFGVWMAGSKACGLGIREDKSLITGLNARFVPHFING